MISLVFIPTLALFWNIYYKNILFPINIVFYTVFNVYNVNNLINVNFFNKTKVLICLKRINTIKNFIKFN